MFSKKAFIMVFLIIFLAILITGCGGVIPTDNTITSTAGTGGSIDPEGVINVSEGGDQTFTIIPLECYQIADVLVDGVSVGAVSTYIFEDIQLDHAIQASFVVPGPRAHNNTTGVDYTTIQAAINAALAGDTIIVCPWTYVENIEFDGKDITVRSIDISDPAIVAATIIDGGGSGSVVRFYRGDRSILGGFTIRNGNAYSGGGIDVIESSPTITGNTITGNMSVGGGGISVVYYSDPTITGNTIEANQADYGGGIYVDSSSPTLTANTITGNDADYGGGIHIYYYSDPTITGNTIEGNTADYGGGISVTDNSFPIISENTINENEAAEGGGIYVTDNSVPIISENTINENNAGSFGGGIYVTNYSDPIIEDNIINDNTANSNGGGIYVYGYSDPLIEDNIINDNTASSDGGGIYVTNYSFPLIEDNIINDNTVGSNGGGIYVRRDSDLLPTTGRPIGWGTGRENIPTGVPLNPTESAVYIITGNEFLGNLQGSAPAYTEGAHVFFQ
jgi:parallel beta-helix repeat protein